MCGRACPVSVRTPDQTQASLPILLHSHHIPRRAPRSFVDNFSWSISLLIIHHKLSRRLTSPSLFIHIISFRPSTELLFHNQTTFTAIPRARSSRVIFNNNFSLATISRSRRLTRRSFSVSICNVSLFSCSILVSICLLLGFQSSNFVVDVLDRAICTRTSKH